MSVVLETSATPQARAGKRVPAGLVALALGSFGIGLTEFVIAGLLPELAAEFAVSIPTAGQLVSVYALAVAVGGVVGTALTAALPPKPVLVALMGLFIAGNLVNAVAGGFGLMMLGRVVAALCHGAFFGIGSVLAASLVAPERKARAIATMFLGLTLANVAGVPLGTWLGQAAGWRSTFWAITAVGVAALAGLVLFVPGVAPDAEPNRTEPARPGRGAGFRAQVAAFRSAQVWASILVTVFGFGAMFGAFTFVAPLLTDVAGMPASAVPWMLVVFGAGLFAGNLAGGKAADSNLDRSMTFLLAALVAVFGVFWLVAGVPWAAGAALFALGGVGFASAPGMQVRVLRHAAKAPTLASGVNIAAFNVGNALGAYLCGAAIAAGFGFRSPLWVGAALAAVALAVMLFAQTPTRRGRTRARG